MLLQLLFEEPMGLVPGFVPLLLAGLEGAVVGSTCKHRHRRFKSIVETMLLGSIAATIR